ncbi:hypothetical protein DHD32_07765 [Arenibacter sp. TNZ]|nr:hypothetical protein [Arenibacter sp. TNZ]
MKIPPKGGISSTIHLYFAPLGLADTTTKRSRQGAGLVQPAAFIAPLSGLADTTTKRSRQGAGLVQPAAFITPLSGLIKTGFH